MDIDNVVVEIVSKPVLSVACRCQRRKRNTFCCIVGSCHHVEKNYNLRSEQPIVLPHCGAIRQRKNNLRLPQLDA